MLLIRDNITNSIVMIQPSLISYSFNSPPAPALLDVASISSDRILLLDAYFSVVVFHGMTIAQWRNMGYQNQPEHQVIMDFYIALSNHEKLLVNVELKLNYIMVNNTFILQCTEISRVSSLSVLHSSFSFPLVECSSD